MQRGYRARGDLSFPHARCDPRDAARDRVRAPTILTKIDDWPPISHSEVMRMAKHFAKCRVQTCTLREAHSSLA
jgi:hypothetical protein